MTAATSARNALKHGFCSLHFLAEEHRDEISRIRLDLEAIHKPELDEEHALISDMALSRFKMVENERVHYVRVQDEKLSAGKIYDMQALNAFREMEARWRDSPSHYRSVLKQDIHGCRHMLDQWQELQVMLSSEDASPSLEKFCEIVLMHGDHWQIQKIGTIGRYLFSLYLAIQADAEVEADHWISISKGASLESNLAIAHELFVTGPPADEARRQLREVADQEIGKLQATLAETKRQHDLERKSFIEKSCGLGLTDPVRSNEARLFQRYYVSERNHALKIERKLDEIKKIRQRKNLQKEQRKGDPQMAQPGLGQLLISDQDTDESANAAATSGAPIDDARIKALARLLHQAQADAAKQVTIATQVAQQSSSHEVTAPDLFNPKPALRHVAWENLASVTAEEAAALKRCIEMPDGQVRNTLTANDLSDECVLRLADRKYTG